MRTTGDSKLEGPVARQISLGDWGVHHSMVTLPYLERSVEIDVLKALEQGHPVLIVGPSMAGKTRMAAKLMQDLYPNRQVIIPDVPDGMAVLMAMGEVPHEAIVWLDDLERYLADLKNMKTRWIDDLRDAGNVIIATMRASQYELFQPSASMPKTQWETLNKFEKIHLLNRHQENVECATHTDDSRLRQGIIKYGLGTYVGGGYIALERLKLGISNNPLGVAMVLAAIDWQRVGAGEKIPHQSMLSIMKNYIDDSNTDQSEESIENAIRWAEDKSALGGVVGLITNEDECWRPFDYLVDHVTVSGAVIPDATWRFVAQSDISPSLLNNAGLAAHFYGRPAFRDSLFQRAAEAGDAEGMANWAASLDRQDRHEEALEFYRRAADAGSTHGMTGVGIQLMRSGQDDEEAERYLRRAAQLGNPDGMANFGNFLFTRGNELDGTEWYRKAAEAGSAYGMTNYGLELAKSGRQEDAESLFRVAAARNSAGGLFELSEVYARRQEDDKSEALCRRAVEGGNPAAMMKLADIELGRGRPDPAERLVRRAALRGKEYLANLGGFLAKQGRLDEAEPILKRTAELGVPFAHHCLGVIAAQKEDLVLAKEHYRAAVQMGWVQSMVNLSMILHNEGGHDESERLCKNASDRGSGQGMVLLALIHASRGQDEDARELLIKAERADDAAEAMSLYKAINQVNEGPP